MIPPAHTDAGGLNSTLSITGVAGRPAALQNTTDDKDRVGNCSKEPDQLKQRREPRLENDGYSKNFFSIFKPTVDSPEFITFPRNCVKKSRKKFPIFLWKKISFENAAAAAIFFAENRKTPLAGYGFPSRKPIFCGEQILVTHANKSKFGDFTRKKISVNSPL